jgi:sulfur transfer complex TusBCD TusB component (DsrH family)
MAEKVLVVFEKPIYLSFEPMDPHLFATALGVVDTPLEIGVLLKDSAVTYAVSGQTVSAKLLGQEIMGENTSPGRMVAFMLEHGAEIRAVREDLEERGLTAGDLIEGVRIVGRNDTVDIIAEHDSVIVW